MKIPFRMPKKDMMLPITGGSNPRPPNAVGVERNKGCRVRKAMPTRERIAWFMETMIEKVTERYRFFLKFRLRGEKGTLLRPNLHKEIPEWASARSEPIRRLHHQPSRATRRCEAANLLKEGKGHEPNNGCEKSQAPHEGRNKSTLSRTCCCQTRWESILPDAKVLL